MFGEEAPRAVDQQGEPATTKAEEERPKVTTPKEEPPSRGALGAFGAALASEATIGVGRGAGGSRVRRVRTESAGARSHGLRPPPSSARERRTDMSITGSVPRPAVLLYDQQFFSRNFC
jgi:hypothetical protein